MLTLYNITLQVILWNIWLRDIRMLGILKKEMSEWLAGKSVEKCTSFEISYFPFQGK